MRTLGRIISHQYVLTGIFPVHINRAFIMATLCGRQAVSDEDLVEAFLEYISENKSQELKAILARSDQGELSGEFCEFLLDFSVITRLPEGHWLPTSKPLWCT